MSNIRFISSRDLEWTETMKESVRHKILEPLERYLKTSDFELSVKLHAQRKIFGAGRPELQLSLTLKTPDGIRQKTVRSRGGHFDPLVDDVSSHLRSCVRQLH